MRTVYAACCVALAPSFVWSQPYATVTPTLQTDGHPFAALPVDGGLLVSVTANGRPGSQTGLRVFAGSAPGGLAMRCLQPLDAPMAMGLATTPGDKGIAVAAGDAGLLLLDRAAVVDGCRARPVTVPMGAPCTRQGSLDVAVTRDGRFAFVADEYGVAGRDSTGRDIQGHVAVVALSYDARGVPSGGRVVDRIVTGGAAVTGVSLSPDGTRLYVASEIARPGVRAANATVSVLARGDCRQGDGPPQPFGLLTVVDVGEAAAGSPRAVVAATAAGCAPVRAAVSADGRTVWVAARGDDRVLAFSAAALEADPARALLGAGDSGGAAPVGLALFGDGRRLAVANSNRFGGPGATGTLAILDADPRAPRPIGTVPATYFPRSVTAAKDRRTLFLTDYDGGQV